jgi:hypothetical protein
MKNTKYEGRHNTVLSTTLLRPASKIQMLSKFEGFWRRRIKMSETIKTKGPKK